MIDYRNIIKNRELRLKLINLLRFIPDEPYLKMVFWIKTGKKLNLKNPRTFCDKLNWLKLHNRRPEFTRMVDKVAVKEHLQEILGEDICLPMLGHWEHYDDIDFDALPDRFVLKCNHDSGSTKVILDKAAMDHDSLRRFFEGRLKLNPFVLGREYPYRDVKPCICAEKYMVPDGKSDIEDFKFMCFNGKPEIMYIITDRSGGGRKDFFDMEFKHLDVTGVYPNAEQTPPMPQGFEQMKELAAKLCKGTDFVRVDFFEINGKVYFGEFTFYDDGGFWPKEPEAWELRMGSMIHLNS
jgi:hypothetical protein